MGISFFFSIIKKPFSFSFSIMPVCEAGIPMPPFSPSVPLSLLISSALIRGSLTYFAIRCKSASNVASVYSGNGLVFSAVTVTLSHRPCVFSTNVANVKNRVASLVLSSSPSFFFYSNAVQPASVVCVAQPQNRYLLHERQHSPPDSIFQARIAAGIA